MRLSGARNSNEQRGAAAPTTMDGGTTVVPTIQRRAAALMAALILIASVGFVVSRSAKPAAADTVFASGQIFASVGGSQVYTYDPTSGLYLNTLTDNSNDLANANPDYYSNGFLTVGSAFDEYPGPSQGDFFVTDDDTLGDSNSQVSEFAPNGAQVATFPGLANPISIAFDGNGDMYVGQQLTAKIAEFEPTPNTQANATAPAGWTRLTDLGTAPADPIQIETSGGPDSLDMSSNQHTIYYTSEGTEVFTYDKSHGSTGAHLQQGTVAALAGGDRLHRYAHGADQRVRGQDPRQRELERGRAGRRRRGRRLVRPERQRHQDVPMLVPGRRLRLQAVLGERRPQRDVVLDGRSEHGQHLPGRHRHGQRLEDDRRH